jgi:mycothiol synthase
VGQPPLSDQALTQLDSPLVRHVLIQDGDEPVGYAQVDQGSAEIAASDPAVIADLLDRIAAPGLLLWSHGKHSPLNALLPAAGFVPVRTLHQLRRPAGAPRPADVAPAGVTIRAFVPGKDEDEWLRVNAAAFAHHPEQGAWTIADLTAREAEDWFDPAGLFLAQRGDGLIGFHWTKTHSDGAGEVYVLAVDPQAQGLRLGSILLGRGLRHLDELGCPYVLLYVDEDNTTAFALYEKYGFTRFDLDSQWQRA